MIGNAYDFPDVYNGGMREIIVEAGTESIISLTPKLIRADAEIRSIPKKIRACVFPDEVDLVYKGYYTLAECLLVCRLYDVVRMCGCTSPVGTAIFNVVYCDLADLPCLARWKGLYEVIS